MRLDSFSMLSVMVVLLFVSCAKGEETTPDAAGETTAEVTRPLDTLGEIVDGDAMGPEDVALDESPETGVTTDTAEVGDELVGPAVTVDLPGHCNILAASPSESCLFPFPTDQWLVEGADGKELALPMLLFDDGAAEGAVVPFGVPRDGYGLGGPLVYYQQEGYQDCLIEGLAPTDTLTTESPYQLIQWPSGERVPLMVEVDAVADPGSKVLYLRPLDALEPATRYVVAITDPCIVRPPVFAAFSTGAPLEVVGALDPSPWRAEHEEMVAFLDGQGVSAGSLSVAWSFTTASLQSLVGDHLLAVRDLVEDGSDLIGWTIDKDETEPDTTLSSIPAEYGTYIARRVTGTLTVPEVDDTSCADCVTVTTQFTLQVPACALDPAAQPVKVALYGHGFFGTAHAELTSTAQLALSQAACLVEVGVDWRGVDEDGRSTFLAILSDPARMPAEAFASMAGLLHQGHADFHALAEMVGDEGFWDELGIDYVDATDPVYLGISSGGIQGTGFAALSPVVGKAALQVPGAGFLSLLERHDAWPLFTMMMGLDSELEVKAQMVLSQLYVDPVDPVTFAGILTHGSAALAIEPTVVLVQEAIDDSKVPNFGTRLLAGGADLPGVQSLVEEVPWLPPPVDASDGYAGSAYAQYDTLVDVAPPEANLPMTEDQHSVVTDCWGTPVSAHEALRRLPAAIEQIATFLYDGIVIQPCSDAVCDPD